MKTTLTLSTTLVLFILSASLNAQNDVDGEKEAGSQISLDPYTVVVFPLEVVGEDPRAAELAAAAYDDIVARLVAIEGLFVLGRDSLLPYAGSELPPEEIARQLGAANALTGSVWVGEFSLKLEFGSIDVATGKGGLSTSFGAGPGVQRPIRVYPDKLLPRAIPGVIDYISARVFPERKAQPQQELAELEAIFLDVSRPDDERLEALSGLTPPYPANGSDTGPDVLSEVVIVAAVQMASSSDDHSVRAGVWGQLGGIRDPYLIQPLLHSLANDDHEEVRQRAATLLLNFLDEPGVREALTYAGDNDPSAEVRRQARFSVISSEAKRAELEATVMDSTLSDQERSRAFSGLPFQHPTHEPSPAVMSAMIDMATNSEDARTRRRLWFALGEYGHVPVVDALLAALAKDPDEEVRSAVVGALGQSRSQPAVRESLEAALTNDSSALVRKQLEDILGQANN